MSESEHEPGLGLDLAGADTQNAVKNDGGYVVLARKYRPKDFSTLIGQEVLVKTLRNAFSTGRLAHAFLLTGVRGVGKTTSARILAKAFNCTGPDDARTEPNPEPCGQCANCQAITEDRHVDVLEIDAASNNGVDYIRELQDELHYRPVQGRFRVYIVDEVHMLSTSAFNAFLKTLEEPPGHVKFIFATTEANKLPITIRSRCQRFDLRRVSAEQLKTYYAKLSDLEGASVDDEALALVAQAADGSVRDGLSMLDQAISMAGQGDGARVSADAVREMLGLNDGARLNRLFELVHGGKSAEALALFAELFADGADPAILARELSQLTHLVTRRKIVGEGVATLKSQSERAFLTAMAEGLSLGALQRTWDLLVKGLDELRNAVHPQMSFEMLLVRLCHTATMPDPDALMAMIEGGGGAGRSDTGTSIGTNSGSGAGADREASPSSQSGASAAASSPAVSDEGGRTPPPMAVKAQPSPAYEAPPSTIQADDLDSNFLIDDSSPRANPARVLSPEALKPVPTSYADMVTLLESERHGLLATHLSEDVRPVSFDGTSIRIRLTQDAPRDIARTLAQTLQALTGQPWDVGLSDEEGDLPLGEQRRMARAAEYQEVEQHPAVAKALATFPDAKIHDIRSKQPSTAEAGGEEPRTLH